MTAAAAAAAAAMPSNKKKKKKAHQWNSRWTPSEKCRRNRQRMRAQKKRKLEVTIDILPLDVLQMILRDYVDIRTFYDSAPLVCRRWRAAIEPLLGPTIHLRTMADFEQIRRCRRVYLVHFETKYFAYLDQHLPAVEAPYAFLLELARLLPRINQLSLGGPLHIVSGMRARFHRVKIHRESRGRLMPPRSRQVPHAN